MKIGQPVAHVYWGSFGNNELDKEMLQTVPDDSSSGNKSKTDKHEKM
jgi:hypothetical protein